MSDHLDSVILGVDDFAQLFLDNGIVEASQELTKTFHQPRRDPAIPLIVKDRP